MEIEFKPTIPSFLHTDRGVFPLSYFSNSEIEEYIAKFKRLLLEQKKQQEAGKN